MGSVTREARADSKEINCNSAVKVHEEKPLACLERGGAGDEQAEGFEWKVKSM